MIRILPFTFVLFSYFGSAHAQQMSAGVDFLASRNAQERVPKELKAEVDRLRTELDAAKLALEQSQSRLKQAEDKVQAILDCGKQTKAYYNGACQDLK